MTPYLSQISEDDEVDLIMWDRDGLSDIEADKKIRNVYCFVDYMKDNIPFISKLKHFYKYRKYALRILKKKYTNSAI